jgi:hypothetical protein
LIPELKNGKLQFPLLPGSRPLRRLPQGTFKATMPSSVDWFEAVLPADWQYEGSCDFRAWCNWMEILLRFFFGRDVIPAGYQLDAGKMYEKYNEERGKPGADEGAQLPDGGDFMIRHGLLHPDTEIVEIAPNFPAILTALLKTPLVQGLVIGPNWERERVNPENGAIPDEELDLNTALGGHASALVAAQVKAGRDLIGGLNSWPNWGWHDIFWLSFETWLSEQKPIGVGPLTVARPELIREFNDRSTWRHWLCKPQLEP